MTQPQAAQTRPSARELLADVKVVDSDTHITEWYDLWTSRAPASLKDRLPRVKMIDGKYQWIIDADTNLGSWGAGASAVMKDGSKAAGIAFADLQLADIHPASYEAKSRVEYMDKEGIAAQIAYPNLLGFGGQKSMLTDGALRQASIEIYNDAMAEFQQESGNRIYPMALMPWWDVKASAKEAERCHKMGLRGINMNSDPHMHGLPHLGDTHWDPLWEVCTDKGLPMNFHIGASDESMTWYNAGAWPGYDEDIQLAYGSVMVILGNQRVLANIFLTQFLDRWPDLKIVSVESGAGWLPFLLEAVEYQMNEAGMKMKNTPREIFQRQIYATSWFERDNLVSSVRALGIDNVMFETDFPHPTCLYPDTLEYVAGAIEAMTPEERGKVFGANAQKLYKLDLK
jgi:uncharacterized protein